MRKVWAATLASVSLAGFNGAFAQEAAPSDTPDSVPSKSVRLSDVELDNIVAGRPIAVIISPPSDVSKAFSNGHMTVIILGSGKGNSIFGTIVFEPGTGPGPFVIIPGGPLR